MTDYSYLFLQMIVVLGLVCLLAFGFLRYILPHLPMAQRLQKNRYIHVVARAHLDPHRQLVIAQIGQRYFLLGSAEGNISLLAELNQRDVGESS